MLKCYLQRLCGFVAEIEGVCPSASLRHISSSKVSSFRSLQLLSLRELYLDVDTVTTSSLLRRVYHKGGNTNDFSRVLGVAIKGRIFLSEKSGQANGFQLKEQEYKAHRSRDENDYKQRILRVLEQW